MGSRVPLRWLRIALIFLIMAGCTWPAGLAGNNDREQYYFNANLFFALEHPVSWSRSKDSRKDLAIRWTAPAGKGSASAQATVLSLSPSQARGGEERMEKDFLAAHPGFTITSRQEERLPAAPASRLTGYMPTRIFLVYFITSAGRAFTLEFSAAPEDFDHHRPLFQEMAESFKILD